MPYFAFGLLGTENIPDKNHFYFDKIAETVCDEITSDYFSEMITNLFSTYETFMAVLIQTDLMDVLDAEQDADKEKLVHEATGKRLVYFREGNSLQVLLGMRRDSEKILFFPSNTWADSFFKIMGDLGLNKDNFTDITKDFNEDIEWGI